MQKVSAINSNAYAHLKSFLNEEKVKILDLYVQGRWLKAILSSGIVFAVRNDKEKYI